MSDPQLRSATLAEAPSIDALMKASIRDIFPTYYDEPQTQASIRYIGSVDRTLIQDGTYYVFAVDDDIVACGGWSRRDKLYTGSGEGTDDARVLDPLTEPARIRAMFTRGDWTRRGLGRRILEACESAAKAEGFRTLALMATLPGLALYTAYGFASTGRSTVRMPDGTVVASVAMVKPID